jgi:hypothetical protein
MDKFTSDVAHDAAEAIKQKVKGTVDNVTHRVEDATKNVEQKVKDISQTVQGKARELTKKDIPEEVIRALQGPKDTYINYLHVFGVAPALAYLAYKPEYVRYTPVVAGIVAAAHGLMAYKKNEYNESLKDFGLRSKL